MKKKGLRENNQQSGMRNRETRISIIRQPKGKCYMPQRSYVCRPIKSRAFNSGSILWGKC